MVFLMSIKLLMALKAIPSIGPTLRIIYELLLKLLMFITAMIFLIILFAYTAYPLMHQNNNMFKYNDGFNTLLYFFDAMIANYEFSEMESSEINYNSNFAKVYFLLYVILAAILMVNLIIAII